MTSSKRFFVNRARAHGSFEASVVRYAANYSVDAVLCGHIHSISIRRFGRVTYYNCGDWVETCSALVEREDGVIEAVSYCPSISPFGKGNFSAAASEVGRERF